MFLDILECFHNAPRNALHSCHTITLTSWGDPRVQKEKASLSRAFGIFVQSDSEDLRSCNAVVHGVIDDSRAIICCTVTAADNASYKHACMIIQEIISAARI